MLTITEFTKKHGLTMTTDRISHNPNMDNMPPGSSHWSCTIKGPHTLMLVPFSMGPALTGAPKLTGVLSCLASDAATVDNARDFEEWADDLGYCDDSRKAEQIYKTCDEQAGYLKNELGDDAYHELLYECEPE